MKRNVFGLSISVLILAAATSLALAADKEKKDNAKPATPSKEPMYVAACPDPCSFSVASHDKAEVVATLQQHAKSHHNMALSDKDADAMVKTKAAKEEKK